MNIQRRFLVSPWDADVSLIYLNDRPASISPPYMNVCHFLLPPSSDLFHPPVLSVPCHDELFDQKSTYPKLFIAAAVVHESQPLQKEAVTTGFNVAGRHVGAARPPFPAREKTQRKCRGIQGHSSLCGIGETFLFVNQHMAVVKCSNV